MDVKIVKSNYGNTVLLVDNYKFKKEKDLKSGESYWRCIKTRTKCTAKIFTVGSDYIISRTENDHNHPPEVQKVNRQIVSTACKRKAIEDIAEKPSKIIRCELEKSLPDTFTMQDIEYVRRNIYNCRRKELPSSLPKSIEEVFQVLENYNPTTCKNENFLFINCENTKLVVFTCETNIRELCRAPQIYMDGTFSYCTKFFYQLFSIHGLKNGHYVPYMFCLLENKQSKTYENLFHKIKSKIQSIYSLQFEPKEVFVDFEKAIHVAIKNIWPNTQIYGCRFHLHQAWYRKIKSLGLSDHYKNEESQIGKWLKYTFGLTYLDPSDVGDCFAFDLYSIKPVNDQLDKYCDYLVNTYIDQESDFPPSLWAECSSSLIRTTNACESFHARFNSSFYSPHPSIFIFIEKLKQFQTETYVKIQSLHIPRKIKDTTVKKKMNTVTSLCDKLLRAEISNFDFVKCVSHLNIPKE